MLPLDSYRDRHVAGRKGKTLGTVTALCFSFISCACYLYYGRTLWVTFSFVYLFALEQSWIFASALDLPTKVRIQAVLLVTHGILLTSGKGRAARLWSQLINRTSMNLAGLKACESARYTAMTRMYSLRQQHQSQGSNDEFSSNEISEAALIGLSH